MRTRWGSARSLIIEGSSDLAIQLREDIIQRRRDGWIAGLTTDSRYFGDLDWTTRWRLLVSLGVQKPPSEQNCLPVVSPRDPKAILRALHDLATSRRDEMIGWYESHTYPGGVRPAWSADGPGDDDESRSGWLSLFMLGAMHTMGWYSPDQHRGFVEECERRGWLATFAKQSQDPESWMKVLDQYLDDKVHDLKYHHWLRQYISIYQLSRWLRIYARIFLALGEARTPLPLAPRLVPREDSIFLPEDAPPLLSILGHGANFVLRELTRSGAIDPGNSAIHSHCYPAHARTVRLLRWLGCDALGDDLPCSRPERIEQSDHIHRFLVHHLGLEGAHFGHTFDLPLLWAARDPSIWNEVTRNRPRPFEIEAPDQDDDDDAEYPG